VTPLLAVSGLTVRYPSRAGMLTALQDVTLDLMAGETVGLVGESGSGKSTLGKALVGLVAPSAGSIRLEGEELVGMSARVRRRHCQAIQMVFQNPDAALNPRLSIGRIIEEPLLVHRLGDRPARQTRVAALMRRVGLSEALAGNHPHQLSGGQRQRVSIARALALAPKIVVADEAVSALDVSIRGQILNVFADLQAELNLAYLFISHDLAVVQQIADRIVVLYFGRVVEIADRVSLWRAPRHPYTRALIDAVPVPDPALARRQRRPPPGEIPSAFEPPSGCAYHERCPLATSLCATELPPLRTLADGHRVACHHAEPAAA
jgi:oligopeptide/dipeptide ABC transporter ATP-binding protein